MEKEKVIEMLRNTNNIKVYNCGLYKEYDAEIKRKYSEDRTSVELPSNYLLIVLENDL